MDRKTLILLVIAALLAACQPVSAPTSTPLPTLVPTATMQPECMAGSSARGLDSSGEVRTYRLYIPRSYRQSQPVALVLGFHGNNSYAEQFESYSGFSTLAEHEGFIVAYLQGAGPHPGWDTHTGSKDVQFARDLIAHLKAICSIDPSRIYATGHSLGGGMVNRLACDLADEIAAIGSVSGSYQNANDCTPARPIAVVALHGTADDVIYYLGLPPGGRMPESYTTIDTPIPQWASLWAGRNGCAIKAETVFRQDPVSAQQWPNCHANADVIFYTIRGGGHGWPNPTDGFDVTQMIWDFFVRHPLEK